jgi:hypothetical protein
MYAVIAIPARRAVGKTLRGIEQVETPARIVAQVCSRWGSLWSDASAIQTFTLTPGSCACGAYVPPPPTEQAVQNEIERRIAKYRKMGWSWEKARRAIESLKRLHDGRHGLEERYALQVVDLTRHVGQVGLLVYEETPGSIHPVSLGPMIPAAELVDRADEISLDAITRVTV